MAVDVVRVESLRRSGGFMRPPADVTAPHGHGPTAAHCLQSQQGGRQPAPAAVPPKARDGCLVGPAPLPQGTGQAVAPGLAMPVASRPPSIPLAPEVRVLNTQPSSFVAPAPPSAPPPQSAKAAAPPVASAWRPPLKPALVPVRADAAPAAASQAPPCLHPPTPVPRLFSRPLYPQGTVPRVAAAPPQMSLDVGMARPVVFHPPHFSPVSEVRVPQTKAASLAESPLPRAKPSSAAVAAPMQARPTPVAAARPFPLHPLAPAPSLHPPLDLRFPETTPQPAGPLPSLRTGNVAATLVASWRPASMGTADRVPMTQDEDPETSKRAKVPPVAKSSIVRNQRVVSPPPEVIPLSPDAVPPPAEDFHPNQKAGMALLTAILRDGQ